MSKKKKRPGLKSEGVIEFIFMPHRCLWINHLMPPHGGVLVWGGQDKIRLPYSWAKSSCAWRSNFMWHGHFLLFYIISYSTSTGPWGGGREEKGEEEEEKENGKKDKPYVSHQQTVITGAQPPGLFAGMNWAGSLLKVMHFIFCLPGRLFLYIISWLFFFLPNLGLCSNIASA